MTQIKTLSEETISQIAAGEVIERPSHLVKELVENALDAGARHIEVDFDQGGRFVQVKDDGSGIAKEDLSLALTRHATSKIHHSDDLWKLKTYGFRGEALASIAAVSDLTMISGLKEGKITRLRKSFGKASIKDTFTGPSGTIVIIRSLFENVPARLKFLKSEGAEHTSIKNTLKALALSKPHIHFRILQKSRLLFYWPAKNTLLERTRQVLGDMLVLKKDIYETKKQFGDFSISAVVSAPNNTLKNKTASWFFVCDRWIESKVIYAALMSAYRGLLMHGEYPLAIISLHMPSSEVDVNIHPSKSEVRFKDSSFIFKIIESSLRELLEKAPWTKKLFSNSVQTEKNLQLPHTSFKKTQFPVNKKEYSKEVLSRLAYNPSPLQKESIHETEHYKSNTDASQSLNPDIQQKEKVFSSFSNHQQLNQNTHSSLAFANSVLGYKHNKQSSKLKDGAHWSSLQVLAQVHLTYIVCQSDRAVIFIDQHASHERILYEKFFHCWKKGGVDKQHHLIPFPLDLEEGQSEALLGLSQELKRFGVVLESLGPNSLAVTSSPLILKEHAMQEGLYFLAKKRLETGDSFAFEHVVSDLCATMACHSAIRAGRVLNEQEMRELIHQMDEYPLSSFCPHGRPVFVEYPISRLEKDFCRVT